MSVFETAHNVWYVNVAVKWTVWKNGHLRLLSDSSLWTNHVHPDDGVKVKWVFFEITLVLYHVLEALRCLLAFQECPRSTDRFVVQLKSMCVLDWQNTLLDACSGLWVLQKGHVAHNVWKTEQCKSPCLVCVLGQQKHDTNFPRKRTHSLCRYGQGKLCVGKWSGLKGYNIFRVVFSIMWFYAR